MSAKYRLKWGPQHQLLSKYDRWRRQGELLGLTKPARAKLGWFIYYHEKGGENALRTCRRFGIGKTAFYKWFAVFDPANLRALEESSRAPVGRREMEVTPLEEGRVVHLKELNPEYGKMKIQALYKVHYQETISSWKCQRVIEKHHLQRKPSKPTRAFKKQAQSKRRTVELKKQGRPGFLVAFDTIVLYRNGLKRYIVTGIDTVSKVAWAHMYSTHSSATAKDLFLRLHAVVAGGILNTCTDNGSEFEKEFKKLMASLRVPHYFSRFKTPKDNPVCERFNGTLKQEFLRMGNWTDDTHEFNRRLNLWLLKYNCYRPHQSLNYQTPFQYHFNHQSTKALSAM
jgi:transposase InsO family protein